VRIASFLPTGTEMLYALGLGRSVVGRSQHCVYPPAVRSKPVVVSSRVKKIAAQDSVKIHQAVLSMRRAKAHQFDIDLKALRRLKPDLVITQNLCSVCAASHTEVHQALAALNPRPKVVTLQAQRFDQVFSEIRHLAELTGRAGAAHRLLQSLGERLTRLRERLAATARRPRVWCCEWLEPPMAAGHWIPEMIGCAGGADGLGEPGRDSLWLKWEQVRAYDPEVIAAMPCSYTIPQTLKERRRLTGRPGWKGLSAVRNRRVFAVTGELFHHAGPRLVNGVELLAHLLHPELFPDGQLRRLYRPL